MLNTKTQFLSNVEEMNNGLLINNTLYQILMDDQTLSKTNYQEFTEAIEDINAEVIKNEEITSEKIEEKPSQEETNQNSTNE